MVDRLDRIPKRCRCLVFLPETPPSDGRNGRRRRRPTGRGSFQGLIRSPALAVAILGLALGMPPKGASAAYFDLVPSVAVRTEVNDNIFFASEDEIDDVVATVTPGLRAFRKSERLTLAGEGRLAAIRYADNDDLDAVDQEALGRIDWRMSERWEVAADAAYTKDSRPDRDILDTGLVQSAEPRWRRRANLTARYLTGETTADTLSYQYENSDYSDRESDDSEINVLQFGHTWNMRRFFNETIGRLLLGYARADFETSEVQSFSGTLGVERKLSEVLSVVCDLGLRYTDTETVTATSYPPPVGTIVTSETVKGWNGVGDIALRYRGEFTSASLTLSHDVREARGRGGTTLRTDLRLWLAHRFTEKLQGSLSGGYYRNRTDSDTVALTDIDEDTYRLQPILTYQWSRDLFLEAAYKFTLVKDRIDRTESTQNLIYARIYWQVPVFGSEDHP